MKMAKWDWDKLDRIRDQHNAKAAAIGDLHKRHRDLVTEARSITAEVMHSCAYNWNGPSAPDPTPTLREILVNYRPDQLDTIRFNVPRAREAIALEDKAARLLAMRPQLAAECQQLGNLVASLEKFEEQHRA